MPMDTNADPAKVLDRLISKELSGKRGLDAWTSFLQAHASLMRALEADLEKETGLALADFDVLAQLANAGGELRMTELANRALISRSGMTRRINRLVDEGLVRRFAAQKSEERRVGKECRSRVSPDHKKKKERVRLSDSNIRRSRQQEHNR